MWLDPRSRHRFRMGSDPGLYIKSRHWAEFWSVCIQYLHGGSKWSLNWLYIKSDCLSTKLNGDGSYIYLESSSPSYAGQTARLISPKIDGTRQQCLEFWWILFSIHFFSLWMLPIKLIVGDKTDFFLTKSKFFSFLVFVFAVIVNYIGKHMYAYKILILRYLFLI